MINPELIRRTVNQPALAVQSPIFESLSLHLDDVEFLKNAFIVQSLVGPLVRFSNRGQYEPFLAKSCVRQGNSWTFQLHDGLKCEDGQEISPETFKRSLMRSLRLFKPQDLAQTPFSRLQQIRTDGDTLILEFNEPPDDVVLEYLAMTPFAFLSDANFEGDVWKSGNGFISSGPYKVVEFDQMNSTCILELRSEWPLVQTKAPRSVRISKKHDPAWPATATLDMSYSLAASEEQCVGLVRETPRALVSVRTEIGRDRFFHLRANRQMLQRTLGEIMDAASLPFENYHRARGLFFGQAADDELDTAAAVSSTMRPSKPLRMRTFTVGDKANEFFTELLRKALKRLNWLYEVIPTQLRTVQEFHANDYDIAFDRSHVDATLDPGAIRILFKSALGPRFPDPENRVSDLLSAFDRENMAESELQKKFNQIIREEAAVIPLYHRGFCLLFSPNIRINEISPLMSIVRYDELVISESPIV